MLCELLYSEHAQSTTARDATPKRDVTVPPVSPSTSIIFEGVNRLKDEASYPCWDTALDMLVPGIVHTYLQSGNFPAEWSITTQIAWKDYARSVLFSSLDPSIQIIVHSTNNESPQLYTRLKERYAPRDAQAYAKLIERFWTMPQVPLTSRAEFNLHVNNDIALANAIRLGKVDIEHVLVAARLFNSSFNDGLSTWRETYLQLHEGEDKLPRLEDMIKSMRTAAYNYLMVTTTVSEQAECR